MEKKENGKTGIAIRLRTLRAEYNKTQAQIAAELGISQQTYSKYENQDTNIDSATIIKICEYYGISSDYLLGLDKKGASLDAKPSGFEKSDEEIDRIVNMVLSKINGGN